MVDFISCATPAIRSLHPYQPGKPIDELEREYGVSDIIKLASNENPLGASPHAITALHEAAKGVWLYPDGGGFLLKKKLAALHGVKTSQITLGNGSSELLELVLRCFVASGDEVLFSRYSFALYPLLSTAIGGVGVAAPTRDWGCDPDALAAHITQRTRAILIANPNNPTGTYVRAAALEEFIAVVPEKVIIVVDEAYFDYASYPATGAADYPDTSRWLERFPNLVVTRTFSKAYGLAGLRIGYALAHPQVAELMNRIRPPFNVNAVALAAAEAALDDKEHLLHSLENNVAGLQQLTAAFTEWECHISRRSATSSPLISVVRRHRSTTHCCVQGLLCVRWPAMICRTTCGSQWAPTDTMKSL